MREAQQAMAEYQAELQAMREKTARLRALRLARDAANKKMPPTMLRRVRHKARRSRFSTSVLGPRTGATRCSNDGAHFSSTLLNIRRTMLLIEPLSQSDRAGSQLLLFRLIGTQSRVSFFVARQAVRRKQRVMSTKLAFSIVPTIEICPNCKSEMTVTQVTPIFLADGFEH